MLRRTPRSTAGLPFSSSNSAGAPIVMVPSCGTRSRRPGSTVARRSASQLVNPAATNSLQLIEHRRAGRREADAGIGAGHEQRAMLVQGLRERAGGSAPRAAGPRAPAVAESIVLIAMVGQFQVPDRTVASTSAANRAVSASAQPNVPPSPLRLTAWS